MNLLDMFRKSKKLFKSGYLGRMWVCAVKYEPWADSGQRYGVVIKNVGIVEASMRRPGTPSVTSDERDPFGNGTIDIIAGPVGYLEYARSAHMWIGFFETEDDAKEVYRKFAADLIAEIESASPKA